MIYDIDSPAWWIRTIPHKGGVPVLRHYRVRVRDWLLVLDPFSTRRYYWADCSNKLWRSSPPPLDKEAGTQTSIDFLALYRKETACQTESADREEVECQTLGLFSSDLPVDSDVWVALGSSVAGLPQEQQTVVYNRLVRFLDLGLLDLRNHSS